MSWTQDGDALVRLLGRDSDDPDVLQAMEDFNIRWAPELDEPEDGLEDEREWFVWRPSSKLGFEFGFQDAADLRAAPEDERGTGALILTQVCFYGEHDGVRSYAGKLPYGLTQQDSRLQAQGKMRAFSSIQRSHRRDVWELEPHRVVIEHKQRGRVLGSVLCKLRPNPWPPLSTAPLPTLKEIVAQFGSTWYAPEMQRLFFPLGLDQCGSHIATHGYADLTRDVGLELYFYRDPARDADHVPQSKGAIFQSAKFYRSRYQDARQWAGELPLGLTFDIAYPEFVKHVGRSPDAGSDENLSGYPEWHFDEYSLHVLYSNVDNVVLCYGLFAPGVLNAS
jgi:hypothetical protein